MTFRPNADYGRCYGCGRVEGLADVRGVKLCERCEEAVTSHERRRTQVARAAMKGTMNPERTHLPGNVTQVRYYRGGGRHYYHDFKPGVRQELLPDGSVRLYHPKGRKVWADDREPGFDRYRHRNPGRQGMKLNTSTLLIAAAAAWFLFRDKLPMLGGSGSTLPPSMQQQPIRFWINPENGNILDSPGLHPPFPGYRPASQVELYAAQGQGSTGYL